MTAIGGFASIGFGSALANCTGAGLGVGVGVEVGVGVDTTLGLAAAVLVLFAAAIWAGVAFLPLLIELSRANFFRVSALLLSSCMALS